MGAQEQVVAVPRLGEHILRGDLSAGAGAVLDDHALAQRVSEPLGDEPRWQVGRPARAEADHEPHGLVRIAGLPMDHSGHGEQQYDD